MALMMQHLVVRLLPWAFLMPSGGWAGEIIGGREARPHSRPYMAFLRIQQGGNYSRCGGFLVAKDFVLTAAHCQGDRITVYLGAHKIKQQEPSEQVIPVCRQIPHPQYNRETLNNDIMILQLHHKATLTKEVGIVQLTSGECRVRPGTECSVAGWGWTSLNTRTNTLQEVNLSVVSTRRCKQRYGLNFPSTMLCVGNPCDPKSTYRGDSGGPLVCDGVAEGIVSFGANNSIAPPVAFTRISAFVPWIKATMQKI